MTQKTRKLTWSNDLSNDCSEWTAACKTLPRVATVLFKFLYLQRKKKQHFIVMKRVENKHERVEKEWRRRGVRKFTVFFLFALARWTKNEQLKNGFAFDSANRGKITGIKDFTVSDLNIGTLLHKHFPYRTKNLFINFTSFTILSYNFDLSLYILHCKFMPCWKLFI